MGTSPTRTVISRLLSLGRPILGMVSALLNMLCMCFNLLQLRFHFLDTVIPPPIWRITSCTVALAKDDQHNG